MRTMSLKFMVGCLAAGLALVSLNGCQKGDSSSKAPAPGGASHPPMAGGGPAPGGAMPGRPMGGAANMPDHDGPTDGQPVALKLDGLNSADELKRALAELPDESLKGTFETAFRMAFSAKQAQRNYPDAAKLAEEVISRQPNFAPAHRVLGYARFNTGDPTGALNSYKKAVELNPNYGEGQYALAFMYAMSDKEAGIVHYRKSVELGVKDERDIGRKFYGIGQ